MTENIDRVFDLLDDLDSDSLKIALSKIDFFIFNRLVIESKRELLKINDEIQTFEIDNKKLYKSGTFEKVNRGGSDLYISIIEWNNESINKLNNRKDVLEEKIVIWKDDSKNYYYSLNPKEKLNLLRNEILSKSKSFHSGIFQIIGPIIYYHLLQRYKLEIKKINLNEPGLVHYEKNSLDEETKKYYSELLIQNERKKRIYYKLFDIISIEFFNLYNNI
jgi:hypothetical protein